MYCNAGKCSRDEPAEYVTCQTKDDCDGGQDCGYPENPGPDYDGPRELESEAALTAQLSVAASTAPVLRSPSARARYALELWAWADVSTSVSILSTGRLSAASTTRATATEPMWVMKTARRRDAPSTDPQAGQALICDKENDPNADNFCRENDRLWNRGCGTVRNGSPLPGVCNGGGVPCTMATPDAHTDFDTNCFWGYCVDRPDISAQRKYRTWEPRSDRQPTARGSPGHARLLPKLTTATTASNAGRRANAEAPAPAAPTATFAATLTLARSSRLDPAASAGT
jgi:hypothetical protein